VKLERLKPETPVLVTLKEDTVENAVENINDSVLKFTLKLLIIELNVDVKKLELLLNEFI
jgi:hypothetical protein